MSKFKIGNLVRAINYDGTSRIGEVVKIVHLLSDTAYKVQFEDGSSSGYPEQDLYIAAQYHLVTPHEYAPAEYCFSELMYRLSEGELEGIPDPLAI